MFRPINRNYVHSRNQPHRRHGEILIAVATLTSGKFCQFFTIADVRVITFLKLDIFDRSRFYGLIENLKFRRVFTAKIEQTTHTHFPPIWVVIRMLKHWLPCWRDFSQPLKDIQSCFKIAHKVYFCTMKRICHVSSLQHFGTPRNKQFLGCLINRGFRRNFF